MKQVVKNDALLELSEDKNKKYTNALLPNANSSKLHFGNYDAGNAIFNHMSSGDMSQGCMGESVESNNSSVTLVYPYIDVSDYDDLPYFYSGANRDYEYEVSEKDLIEDFFGNNLETLCDDFPEFDELCLKTNYDFDKLDEWISKNIDVLIEKYNDEILDIYREAATEEFLNYAYNGDFNDLADIEYEQSIDMKYEGMSMQEAWDMMNYLYEAEQKDPRDSIKNKIKTKKFSGIVYYNDDGKILKSTELVGAVNKPAYVNRYKDIAENEKSKMKDFGSYRVYVRGEVVLDSELQQEKDDPEIQILTVNGKNSGYIINNSELNDMKIDKSSPLETIAVSLDKLSGENGKVYAIMKNGELIFNTKNPKETKLGKTISGSLKSIEKGKQSTDSGKLTSEDVCQIVISGFRTDETPKEAMTLYKSKKFKCLSNKVEDTVKNQIKTISAWKMANGKNSTYSAWVDVYVFNADGEPELRYYIDPSGMRPKNSGEDDHTDEVEEPTNTITDNSTETASDEDSTKDEETDTPVEDNSSKVHPLQIVAKKTKQSKSNYSKPELELMKLFNEAKDLKMYPNDLYISNGFSTVFNVHGLTNKQIKKINGALSYLASVKKDSFELRDVYQKLKSAFLGKQKKNK